MLVIISGNSLVFSRKIITSTGFYSVLRPRRVSTSSGKKSVSHKNPLRLFFTLRKLFHSFGQGYFKRPFERYPSDKHEIGMLPRLFLPLKVIFGPARQRLENNAKRFLGVLYLRGVDNLDQEAAEIFAQKTAEAVFAETRGSHSPRTSVILKILRVILIHYGGGK